LLIARAVAANTVSAEVRRAIASNGAALALRAATATNSTAIDIGFVAVLDAVLACETRFRFGIAKNPRRAAISIGIAFDAIAGSVARLASAGRTRRALCQGRLDLHAASARRHVTIVRRRIVHIDGFFPASAVALNFFAVARDLRL
jgi:hypothetical protein